MAADIGVLVAILGIAGLAGLAGYCFGYNRGEADAWPRETFDPDPERVPLRLVS
jgi:hypothetical protein